MNDSEDFSASRLVVACKEKWFKKEVQIHQKLPIHVDTIYI